jgi:ankyrin repeat protein
MILQNSNLKLFQALIAGSSPATKAIARTFLPSAIDSLDFSLVSALLDTGISPNCCVDVSRRRPLQIALLRKSIEMTQLLLDRGADVNLSFPMSSSVDADTPLKVAVEIGRLDLVQLLLRAGAHVNDPEAGHTPSALQIASRAGHIDLMQLLLVAGADVHARVTYGSTALQAAAGAGNIAVVRLLLSHGADVHAASEEHGLTALESAARSDNVEITQLLISHGATGIVTAIDVAGNSRSNRVVNHLVNSRMRLHATLDDTFGKVALRAATKCADFGLVQKLLECGVCANAPPTAGETNSETLPQIAARHGNTRIAELLISYGADVNAPPDAPLAVSFCVTAFQEAVRESHMHLVQRFLYRGANVNAPAAPGSETALAAAAHLSGMKIFRLLVDHCADMKTQAASVLIDSIGHVSLEVLRFLLDTWTLACGGNLDCNHWTASRDGQTALEIAAECDDVELIRLLLEHEAGDKSLALRGAVLGGSSMEIMELLLVSGAVVGCLDDDHRQNMTALQEAARDIRPDVLRLLLEHRSHQTAAYEKSRALQMSALESNFDAARLLLDHGADVNAAPSPLNYGDDGTKTALQAAAGKGDLKMVRFLLEAGADVESKVLSEDEEGTALQFAAIAGSMSVVTTLVQAGADVNAPVICGWGRTAIEGAAEHGRLDIVQFLLDLGVEASGSRAMQLARKEGHDGVVALLEEGGWEVDE